MPLDLNKIGVTENTLVKLHQLYPNGLYNSSQLEIDPTDRIISNTPISVNVKDVEKFINWENDDVKLEMRVFVDDDDPMITLIKIEDSDLNTETVVSTSVNLSVGNSKYVFTPSIKQQNVQLSLPDATIISCQNCDTAFPTKYQYQRHQCEFNADKVVLKPEIVGKDIDKATRLRFECETCKKTFVSNNNLERHKSCHTNNKTNICEYCKKTFVSENRLKIHKENHCKKAGDMTKFYRSDVVVWHCENCKQVFATQQSGSKHAQTCAVIVGGSSHKDSCVKSEKAGTLGNDGNDGNDFESNFQNAMHSQTEKPPKLSKVVTEILYQCEFCNQTYITKSTLLEHQSSHTTEKNYECTFCNKYFNSYNVATSHWQNKCTEESNLFYLPKMIYCEHCDRGFKSHEILYSHKNKKKHFTPKMHEKKINEETNDTGNENAIVKLIESMITKMDKKANEDADDDGAVRSEDNESEGGKKKRGRKRKWHKVDVKSKKQGDGLVEGYMYQCERCSVVFKDIGALDAHKSSQHVSIYSCGQCGQVRMCRVR